MPKKKLYKIELNEPNRIKVFAKHGQILKKSLIIDTTDILRVTITRADGTEFELVKMPFAYLLLWNNLRI